MSNRYCSLILPALLSAGALATAGAATAETLSPPEFASAEGNVLAVALIQRPAETLAPAIVWDRQKHGKDAFIVRAPAASSMKVITTKRPGGACPWPLAAG